MTFHLLPSLLHDKMSGQSPSSSQVCPVVIVVSALKAPTKDQIRISQGTLKAAALNATANKIDVAAIKESLNLNTP